MAKIRINGDTSGYIEISAPAVAGSTSITLPATTGGNFLVTDSSGNLNVDSGTLYVDATNNRVGIGTTSPGDPLSVTQGSVTYAISPNSGASVAYAGTSSNHTVVFISNNSEKARLTTNGQWLVGTSSATANGGVLQVSNGITFPATQSACSDANTLDDYEEGTWTPAFTLGSGSVTYSIQNGIYVKTGRQVTVSFWIVINTVSSPSGQVNINLPFTSAATEYRPASVFRSPLWSTVTGLIGAWVPGSSATARIITFNNGGATDTDGARIAAGCELDGSLTYYV